MLYFCLLTESEEWIIAIIKKSLQISFLLSSSLLVHPVPCMSSCLLSLKMSESWYKSIFWKVCTNQFCNLRVGWIVEPNMCTLRLMEIPQHRTRFKPWLLLGHLGTLRPGQNELQLKETLQLKARWLSSRRVAVFSSETQ